MLYDSRFFFPIYPPADPPPFHTQTLLLLRFAGHECKLVTPFEGGVIQYLATNGNTEAAKNPHTTGEVIAAMSSIGSDGSKDGQVSGHPSRLVEQSHDGSTTNRTESEPDSWVSVDLGKDRSLVPNYYCARHGFSHHHGYGRLRSWDFEGSNDGSNYTVLRAHKNDYSLPGQGFAAREYLNQGGFGVAAWEVEGGNQAYRYFRIRQTAKNSDGNGYSGNHSLYCAGIELYGILLSR
jgi:hypothetical protein